MNASKFTKQCTTKWVTCCMFLLGTAAQASQAQVMPDDARYLGHNLAQASYRGYQPTMNLYVEQDEMGRFYATHAEPAKVNHAWMDQDSAKTGSAAIKALVKLAAKSLYRSFYQKAGGEQSLLPDEEGRLNLSDNSGWDMDYSVHVSGSEVQLAVQMNF